MKSPLLTTLPYGITHVRYFAILVKCMLRDWWSLLLPVLLILAVAAFADLRFAIVLLLLLFLVLPMLLFMLYYNYALRPECYYSVVVKTVELTPVGISCTIEDRTRPVARWQQVRRVEVRDDAFLLFTGKYAYFYLPFTAFATPEERRYFVDTLLPVFMTEK